MLSNLAKFTLVLSPLLLSASVLPADAVSRLRPRDGDNLGPWGPGVYMCTEPNWKGDCLWYGCLIVSIVTYLLTHFSLLGMPKRS